jgi:hypothetical protein
LIIFPHHTPLYDVPIIFLPIPLLNTTLIFLSQQNLSCHVFISSLIFPSRHTY